MARRNTQLLSDAVDWIAANDDAECTDAATVAETLTVCLVADVFGRTRDNVAALVVAARRGDTNHHAPETLGQESEFAQLFTLVRTAIKSHGLPVVASAIDGAHRGRPDGLVVTTANQHLFRKYRNQVSGNAAQLIDDAQARTH